MAIDPLTLGVSTAASVAGSALRNRAANEDYQNRLREQQYQTQSDINQAGAQTTFGNNFLQGYQQKYGGIVDQNSANNLATVAARTGAVAPTVAGYAAPAQEAERSGLEAQRYNAAAGLMGGPASAASIPLKGGMGAGATKAEYDKRFATGAASANDIAARRSALGSWDDIWNRNALREGETQRGLGVAEAMGKSKADVINQAAATNTKSLSALPALQQLVGEQARSAPITAAAPTNTSLAQILGGLGNLGGAVAGAGGPSAVFGNMMPNLPGRGPIPSFNPFG